MLGRSIWVDLSPINPFASNWFSISFVLSLSSVSTTHVISSDSIKRVVFNQVCPFWCIASSHSLTCGLLSAASYVATRISERCNNHTTDWAENQISIGLICSRRTADAVLQLGCIGKTVTELAIQQYWLRPEVGSAYAGYAHICGIIFHHSCLVTDFRICYSAKKCQDATSAKCPTLYSDIRQNTSTAFNSYCSISTTISLPITISTVATTLLSTPVLSHSVENPLFRR